jgi:hypothetical protein
MRFFIQLIGFALILLGIYFLGRNIFFTTNVYPYFWRGIAADLSILFLVLGTVWLVALPMSLKSYGWIFVGISIVLIFASSRAVLNPTSLWQFFISFASMAAGYRMLATGRLRF